VAIEAIDQAAKVALTAAGIRSSELTATVVSAAGADWPEDFHYLQEALSRQGLGNDLQVVNDAMGALRAGSPDGTGVVVACGTGTATGARSPADQVWHSSFWQEPQGSLDLAKQTLRAVYRAELAIDPPTALTEAVLAFFGVSRVETVLHQFTARNVSRPTNLADLSRVLLDLAAAGDPTAHRIVVSHGTALGDYALAAARQVAMERTAFPLVLTGGVVRHPSPLLREVIITQVRTTSPEARPLTGHVEPVMGALLLAFEHHRLQVVSSLRNQIVKTMPPLSFFAT
jgi:N-acetylglucosamine kinase-like BadF-type ATPase